MVTSGLAVRKINTNTRASRLDDFHLVCSQPAPVGHKRILCVFDVCFLIISFMSILYQHLLLLEPFCHSIFVNIYISCSFYFLPTCLNHLSNCLKYGCVWLRFQLYSYFYLYCLSTPYFNGTVITISTFGLFAKCYKPGMTTGCVCSISLNKV